MRRRILLMLILFLVPTPAIADDVDTRCGFSLGLDLGVTVPMEPEIFNEFDVFYRAELMTKYYLIWGLSLGAGFGIEYGEGEPEHYYAENQFTNFDEPGVGNFLSVPMFGVLRVEFWRKGIWNPYIGGGGGIAWAKLVRKGYVRRQPVSGADEEWIPTWFGLAGFDVAITKYVAVMTEWKYRWLISHREFFDKKDFGGIDVMVGVRFYF